MRFRYRRNAAERFRFADANAGELAARRLHLETRRRDDRNAGVSFEVTRFPAYACAGSRCYLRCRDHHHKADVAFVLHDDRNVLVFQALERLVEIIDRKKYAVA